MARLSRFVLAAALVSGAACSGTPTAPPPTANTMTPGAGPLFDLTPSEDCRGGFSTANGKAC
jgi:hypothetical protein